ncbi:MAG: translocation/assembly module TamB [Marinilabiliales bacterium]|nr:translocation/assembly module TamB [Marinilabiliales bacterium]
MLSEAREKERLNINLSSGGDIRMVGDYVIRDGDYLFTLGNILNKRFTVENGGTISWNGAIDDANLNIRALYRTKASLSDIYGSQEDGASGKASRGVYSQPQQQADESGNQV